MPGDSNTRTEENSKQQNQGLGFSIDHMDTTADPHEDFFRYSAGNWLKNNPIPEDKSLWGTFLQLMEKNTMDLNDILLECESSGNSEQEKMLGHMYRSVMNTEKIEKLGFSPVQGHMEKVDRLKSMDEFLGYVSELSSQGLSTLWHSFSRADKRDSSVYSYYFMQGGINLPSRDYYIDDSFRQIRESYLKHMETVFSMYGLDSKTSGEFAESIMSLETDMAKASRSQTELRDAEKNYNRYSTDDIDKEFPNLKLNLFLERMGVPQLDFVVIGQPEYFTHLNSLLKEDNLEKLKIVLKWNILTSAAPFLFSKLEEEHFDMFSRKIRGQPQQEDRWKRAVHRVDELLGESLGELFVKKHFGEEARERMEVMIQDIKEVFEERLKELDWMTEETRKQALVKFGRFKAKIGHPDTFRDYSSVKIVADDYFGNVIRATQFEVNRHSKRAGTPVDRNEWFMTPPTINAYFSPPDNEIVFPAGILQPPFFDVEMDDAVNYGAIGGVISHEITHGYDDQGRRYDENGNLRNWWNKTDLDNFLERANKVVEVYNSLEVLPGLNVNGELTLGENIADFGGVSIAYAALQRHLRKNPHLRKKVDGLDPEQRFFISWAQVWRENIKDEESRLRVSTDPHSPNRFRAQVPVYNHPAFEETFPNSSNSGETKPKIDIW